MERFDRVSNRVANLDEWRSRQDRGESNNGDAVGQSEDDADEDLSMRRPMILPSEEGGDRLFPADGRLRSADDGEAPDRPRPNTGSGGLPLRERLGAGDNDGTDDVDGPRPNRPRLRPYAGPRRRPNPEGGDDDGGEQEGELEEAEEGPEEGAEEAAEEGAEEAAGEGAEEAAEEGAEEGVGEAAEEAPEVQGYEEAEETLREYIQELGRAMRSA
ncbi:PREDICTED: cyclin-dependent kinase inhibitor 1C-like [Branchiostoma belcheri]|uniref:Cyclin-dependent kinase inhibitor 1C-like n=1 Tax=Branchiostoma belcheri TaxID=7741 RepID=A0A6P5AFC1_BRABE|nr:PREDICTED: cyclin-dependent kinase inhibitor 1C-like [Branchiostoma belcheri]